MQSVKSKDGTVIAYDTYGSGPPLIFVAGATCHRLFIPIVGDAKVFGRKFTVYSYDRRGRGDSGDTKPYSIDRELEDIEALIDAAGGSAYIYGHSSGAVLALEAALKFPRKVKKAVMYEAPYTTSESERGKNEATYSRIEQILTKSHAQAIRHFLKEIGMPALFGYLLPLMPGWGRMKSLAPTLLYDLKITNDLPPLDRASKMEVPTLILFGAKSNYDFASTSFALSGASSNIRVEKVERQDHMVSPKVLLPIFERFFLG